MRNNCFFKYKNELNDVTMRSNNNAYSVEEVSNRRRGIAACAVVILLSSQQCSCDKLASVKKFVDEKYMGSLHSQLIP